jgi:hypothetical protein
MCLVQDPDDSLLMDMHICGPIEEQSSAASSDIAQQSRTWLTTAARISAAHASIAGLAHGDLVTLQPNFSPRYASIKHQVTCPLMSSLLLKTLAVMR